MICEACNKEGTKFTQLFDKLVCDKCMKDFEEGSDDSNLYSLYGRKGLSWILEKLSKYVEKKKNNK